MNEARTLKEVLTYPFLEIGGIYNLKNRGVWKKYTNDESRSIEIMIIREFSRYYLAYTKSGYHVCINKNSLECGDSICERVL